MKFKECAECYFHRVEPAVCSECRDANQFEPSDVDEESLERIFGTSQEGDSEEEFFAPDHK